MNSADQFTRRLLRDARVRSEATVLSSVSQHQIEAIIRAMRPRMIKSGVISPDELAVDGLNDQLANERAAAGVICLWELVFGVVARGCMTPRPRPPRCGLADQ